MAVKFENKVIKLFRLGKNNVIFKKSFAKCC